MKCKRVRKNHSASVKQVAHHLKEEEIHSIHFLMVLQIKLMVMALNQTNKTLTNARQSLHTHQTSPTIFCWTRTVWANWTIRFKPKINMRKIWTTEVSKTCRRQQVWRYRMAGRTMVDLKISNFMLLCLSTSFSWTAWIIREPVTANSSTSWALAQQSIIRVYFEDILVTEICSIKIWKREIQGLQLKLRK